MKKQGISLMILITTVIIISLLTGTAVVTGKEITDNLKGLEFATNIANIEYCYNNLKDQKSFKESNVESIIDLTNFTEKEIKEYFPNENIENKSIKLSYIKLEDLGLDLKQGNFEKGKEDYFAISKQTNKIYYLNGLKLGDKKYYYLTDDLRKRYNINEEEIKNNIDKYTNNSKDKIAPTITTGNIIENMQSGKVVINDVIAKDDSGKIKKLKYELECLNKEESRYYFAENGMLVKNNKIELEDMVQKVTIYAEDYSGNYNIITINCNNEYMKPKLSNNMVPIRYKKGKWQVCKETDPLWYDYSSTSKKWANVMISDKKLEEGTVVKEEDLGDMYVWIPRFAYSINKFHTENKENEIAFDIMFMKDANHGINNKTYNKDYEYPAVGTKTPMIVHPAFTVNNNELSGIWIAKFPVNENNKINPNGKYKFTDIATAFSESKNKNSLANSHLTTNTEWGAIAYLTSSKYGNKLETNTEKIVAKNNYKIDAYKLSTTGNVTGIYDLNSKYGEYVAGYLNYPGVSVENGNWNIYNPGNTEINTADNSFKKKYVEDILNNLKLSPKGDAMYETIKSGAFLGTISKDEKTWILNPNDNKYTPGNSYYGEDSVLIGNIDMPYLTRGGVNREFSESGLFAVKFVKGNDDREFIKYRPVLNIK